MPRNTSGVYTLPSGNPVIPGTTIDAAWANDTMEDMANEITNSLSRTGAGGMLAPFRIANGTVTAPGLSFLNETNTGLYRSGAGSTWMSVLGVNTVQFSTVGLTIPFGKALTAQGNASVSGTFAVTGATTLASTLAVTGALSATGGVLGNVTAASGTSTFNNVTINGNLDMDASSSGTITNLPNPVNSGDAANKAYVDAQDALRLALTGGTMTGAIAMSNNKVTGVATPTADQDAATKAYVDSVAQGIDAKASCAAATTGNITLSGTQTIDGYALVAGQRVLVKDQSTASQNGIYVVAAGSWSRSADADTWDKLVAAFTFVEHGTTNANNGYICTIPVVGTLGTTPVTWAQFSGAGQITAGTGMSKTGNTLNVNTASSARIVVGADEIDLATTGVTASTYKSVTVDAWGRVTAGTNPTTLAGFGIGDAYTQAQTDTLLAAKLSTTGGTMSGALAMGTNKITGLGDPTNAQDAATKSYIDTIFGSTTSAAASAATATTQAGIATTQAGIATTQAGNAATSANNSATSLFNFRAQYLGPSATDPTVDGNGNALTAGDLYYNTSVNEMRVYSGSAWLAAYLPATGYLALSGGTMTGAITFVGGQTFPGTGDVTLTGTQTLTNKTLTDPKLLLAGTNGTAGQVPVSQGAGLPPVWGAVSSPEIKTPTNVSPATGATNIGATPALTGSTFYSLYGVAMAASQWQVSTVSDFASTVVSTGDVAGTSVTYTVASGVLSVSTLYYWRVRYKDANGVYSEWSTATTFTTAASFGPTTIGEAYGGGYYAGKIVQGGSTYYLIVAPKSSGENSSKQWKTSNDAGPSATITLNNGPAASSSMNSASYPAAQFCEGLSIGGYTDWYLPARDELELCYRNLKPTTTANSTSARNKSSYTYPEGNDVSGDTMGINRNSDPTGAAYTSSVPAQTSVTLFQTGNSEAFAAVSYWSSSEYSATYAWIQDFSIGTQSFNDKNDSLYVRAVRRLPV